MPVPYSQLPRLMPPPARPQAWFRPRRRMPPEVGFIAGIVLLAYALCWLAEPLRPAVTASVAPQCADAPQPCRGVR